MEKKKRDVSLPKRFNSEDVKRWQEQANLTTGVTHLYSDILNAFDANKNHKIVGCDRMQKFQICLSNKEDLLKTAQELWDNPNTFYTEENNKDYDQY